jgi:hypothetical protein
MLNQNLQIILTHQGITTCEAFLNNITPFCQKLPLIYKFKAKIMLQ